MLHGVVEMAEMSQVDAQPRKRVLLEHTRPENRICSVLIIGVWPEAMAGMRHDRHVIGATPRVESFAREGGIEFAADMRPQPRVSGTQIRWLVEVPVRQMFFVLRPKSHRRIQLDADKSPCEPWRLSYNQVIYLDGGAHDPPWVPTCGAAPIIRCT